MESINTNIIDEETHQKLLQSLLAGDFSKVENTVSARTGALGAQIIQGLMNEAASSEAGQAIVEQLKDDRHYQRVRQRDVPVILSGERKIRVVSYYGLRPDLKQQGRPRQRQNGEHILLKYWGFHHKRSQGSLNEIARCGASSASFELASEHLKSQGISLSDKGVRAVTKTVGDVATAHRSQHHLALAPGESLAGKRVGIGSDGGRIRSRQPRTGRHRLGKKQPGYNTDWREPKLLVIFEVDEFGNKKKGAKPIYEATMGGKRKFAELLISLCTQLQLNEAQEIVCLGDGAPVLWDVFKQLQEQLGIKSKTTEVVDFFHACEHITELTEAHTNKTATEQKAWAKELKVLLRTGKHQAFCSSVKHEAKKHNLSILLKHLGYFIRHKQRMHYDQYEKAKLPIGSGIVESAVRRVINGRLKAPGTFWKLENVEHMLSLRSALLAGRWNIFMDNFRQAVSLLPERSNG